LQTIHNSATRFIVAKSYGSVFRGQLHHLAFTNSVTSSKVCFSFVFEKAYRCALIIILSILLVYYFCL